MGVSRCLPILKKKRRIGALTLLTQGLVVDLNADTLAATLNDDDGVATWPNDGSGSDFTSPQASQQPTFKAADGSTFNNHAWVNFNEDTDNDEFVQVAATSHADSTVFVVCERVDTNTHHYPLVSYIDAVDGLTQRLTFFQRRNIISNEKISVWDPDNLWSMGNSLNIPAVNTEALCEYRYDDGTGVEFWIDGVDEGSDTRTTNITAFGAYMIGMSNAGETAGGLDERFDGKIARVLVYNRKLTDAERSSVSLFLRTTYNL